MKNLITKTVTVFIFVSVIAIGLKVSDNILANADASTGDTADACGVNNGYIWNGTQCVNTCDINHPWDPIQKKCSTSGSYTGGYYYGSGYGTNCVAAYGSNFYFDGKNCVQINPGVNANYYGNPYNGGTTNPVYNNQNYNYSYNNTNYNNNYNNGYVYTNNCNNSCYHDDEGGAMTTTYYIYTTTTTTSQPGGTPIPNYGTRNYYNNYNNNYNNNWYNNGFCSCFTDCYNDYYTYNYTGYTSNNNYNNYYNNYNNYSNDYHNTGYYDIYGIYHY